MAAAAKQTPRAQAALELCLYDEINTWSVRGIVERLQMNPGAEVTLRINSPGGDVQEGFALSSALRTHQGRKVAVVEGVCASAATFPLCACDEVRMHPESFLMVHAPWGGATGNAEEIEEYAAVLRQMESLMVSMYQRKTGADETTVRSWMEKDTWLTPQQALEAGFCDEIITDAPALSARASAARFAAKLKLPSRAPAPANKTRKNMEEIRDKLAKYGLAEDGGNVEEALARYLSETEDGPQDRQATAKAAQEYMQSRTKAKEDEEESSTGDGGKARLRKDAASDPAVQKLIAQLTSQVESLGKKVAGHEESEKQRAEKEFYASAALHTSRKDAEEYLALCEGDTAKALKLIQKLPRKAGAALDAWYAGGSPVGGASRTGGAPLESVKSVRLGNTVVNLHGSGLRELARKIQGEKKCSLLEAYKLAARERPDLARATA